MWSYWNRVIQYVSYALAAVGNWIRETSSILNVKDR